MGNIDKRFEINLESYFRKWGSLAKSLTYPEWIIDNIKFPYNEKIQEKFESRDPQTISEG